MTLLAQYDAAERKLRVAIQWAAATKGSARKAALTRALQDAIEAMNDVGDRFSDELLEKRT